MIFIYWIITTQSDNKQKQKFRSMPDLVLNFTLPLVSLDCLQSQIVRSIIHVMISNNELYCFVLFSFSNLPQNIVSSCHKGKERGEAEYQDPQELLAHSNNAAHPGGHWPGSSQRSGGRRRSGGPQCPGQPSHRSCHWSAGNQRAAPRTCSNSNVQSTSNGWLRGGKGRTKGRHN